MRKLLNTFICILLTSPLAAFDIALDGVEFGSLQMPLIEANATLGPFSFIQSNFLTLNDGDVLQVLRLNIGSSEVDFSSDSNNGSFRIDSIGMFCNQEGIVSRAYESDFVVGPSTIWVGCLLINPYSQSYIVESFQSHYVQMDYAILRAGASTQSSYVTIPANPSGNFEVKLQTSTDLETWTPTTPGVFPYGDNAKFFRLIVK